MRIFAFFLTTLFFTPSLHAQAPLPPSADARDGAPPLVNAPNGNAPSESIPLGTAPDEPTFYTPPVAIPAGELAASRKLLETLEAQLRRGEIPVDARNLALLRLKVEQSRLLMSYLETNIATSPQLAKGAMDAYLQRAQLVARTRGDAALVTRSPMHERAYIAANDGSTQPFWIFLPDDYSPRRTYPLIVFLHGYSPQISKVDPWLPGEETWRLATRRDSIMALPYGRRNSDFVDVGEDDTLRVLEEVQKHYSVDARRVFLMGPSMGGYGAYAVGLHHPDRWTGLMPMAARSDFYLWFGLRREAVAAWKRSQYDADDPRTLARNAFALPIFTQHGALDNINSVEHSRRLQADMKALGNPFTYREIPNGDHFIYFGDEAYERAFDWMKTLRAPAAPPRRVVYVTANARNDGAYWARIDAFENYSQIARIDATIVADTLEVKTENVAAFTLSPPIALLQKDAPLRLKLNGIVQAETYDAAQPLRWDAAAKIAPDGSVKADATPAKSLRSTVVAEEIGGKTARRCGPIKNAYRDAFLIVYGTVKSADGQVNDDEIAARRWARAWDKYADGMPPIKADSEVTSADRERYNLILFGSTQSNSLLKNVGARLPLEWKADAYRVGAKWIAASGHGVQFCYPSPWSKERLIVVHSGAAWGAFLPINHQFDLLPDYIVFERGRVEVSDKTNRALQAGFFNRFWQLNKTAG